MPYFYGDSIAVGFGGSNPGRRREGASPREILGYIQQDLIRNPDLLRGQRVNLSTGVSNNPSDLASIAQQLQLLNESGAIVDLIGASKQRYGRENQALASLAEQYGVRFLGGFEAGPDLVHPLSYDPARYFGSASQGVQASATPAVAAPVVVLAKLRGRQGKFDKSSGQFVEQPWTPEEAQRYATYEQLGRTGAV